MVPPDALAMMNSAMRILHLLQPLPPRASWLAADPRDLAHSASHVSGEGSLHALRAVLADNSLPAEHIILSLGPSQARDFTRSAGLADVLHASPPLARAANAGPLLRRLLRRTGDLDALVAWGPAAALPIAKTAPEHRARALTIDPRTGVLSRTFDASQSITLPAHLPAPHARSSARELARNALNLANHELAVVALGDAAMPPDAVALNLAAQSHSVTGRMLTLVVPACSANLDRALRHIHEMAYIYRVILHDGPLAPILPACDAAVVAPAPTPEQPTFAAALWAQLWHIRAPGPLIAPADLLPAHIPHHPARSARPTDLAGALLTALTSPLPAPAPLAADPIAPATALHRAIQHLLALPTTAAT
jgi:hypothetical protein